MSALSVRSTVYFDQDVHRALRLKAASAHRSLSEVVNEAMRQALREDQDDLAAFENRVAEPTMTYEALLKVIPKDVCDALSLSPGQKVQTVVYRDRIELIPVRPIKKMRGFLKGIDTTVPREGDRV
jgi:plasmid stability protein